jgi:hypothetical protein
MIADLFCDELRRDVRARLSKRQLFAATGIPSLTLTRSPFFRVLSCGAMSASAMRSIVPPLEASSVNDWALLFTETTSPVA